MYFLVGSVPVNVVEERILTVIRALHQDINARWADAR